MSRIRPDIKPSVKGLKSSGSLTKSNNVTGTIFPPVSLRSVSSSPRGSVDLKWTLDMVRGYNLHGAEKPKVCGVKNFDSSKTNPDYEKLYQKYTSLQKLIAQLRGEIKVKSKMILDLTEKLDEKEEEYNKNLEKYKETITQHELKIENFYEQVKQLKDAMMQRTEEMDALRKELAETQKKCNERIENILKENEAKTFALAQSHKEELASRDSKVSVLKMQLESALSQNSRERQRQLDELTKELTRVTDETELLKAKLRSLAKQRQSEQCRNCIALEETLQAKLKELRSKDESITALLEHGQKMAKQLSKQDKFLKVCERASVNFQ